MTELGNITIPIKGETFNQLFFAPFVKDVSVFDTFRIFPNMKKGETMQLLKIDNFSGNTRRADGCGFDPKGNVNITERWLRAVQVKADAQLCEDELTQTVFAAQYQNGADYDNITGTQIARAVMEKIAQGVTQDIMELAFWGNEKSSSPFLQSVDGIWSYVQQGVIDGDVVRLDNKSNTTLALGEAVELMLEVLEKAQDELRGMDENMKVIYISPDMYYALRRDLIDGSKNSAAYTREVIDGRTIERFYGIEIRKITSWTKYGKSEFDLDVAQNLIMYVAKQNLAMGTDATGMNSDVKMQWEDFERLVRYRAARPLAFNYIHPELITVHY